MSRVHWSGAGVFLLFALVQLNDPDPLGWVIVYGATAFYSAAAALGRLPRSVPIAWSMLWLCGLVFLAGLWDGAARPMGPAWMGPLADEIVREMLGLLLVSVWSAFLAWSAPQAIASDT